MCKTMKNSTLIRVLLLLVMSITCHATTYECDKNSVPCGCGEKNVGINARIVNGENSIPNSWSMIVSLKMSRSAPIHACGGSILNEFYILTAAHCVDQYIFDFSSENLTIAAGIHNLSQPNQIIRRVDKIIIHPLWRGINNLHYDIALLHLAEPLDLTKSSPLIRTCLPPRSNSLEEIMQYPLNGTSLVVIGWGRLASYGLVPAILQQVTINSISHFDRICSVLIRDPSSQFCAGLYEGGKGKK